MVSAISLCLLALGLTAASSQLLSNEPESTDAPISERRTFKHGKPVKLLPFAKKHKKFAVFAPHAFGKAPYDGPVVHEVSRPFYKVHRYHGIEVKPVHSVSYSTPEPYVETHSIEPPSGDFSPSFSSDSFSSPSFSDHSFSSSSSFSDHSSYVYDKPSFPSPPPAPIFAPLPPSPPKPIFSFVPAPQPVFQSIPVAPPAFSSISIPRPAPIQSLPAPAPVFTSIPSSSLPPQPVFSVIPIKIQTPVLPAPSPAPIFQSVPIKIHHPAPALPSLPAPSPAPIFQSIPIKIHHPVPALPSLPAPTPAPALPALPAPSPTPIIVKIPSPVLPALPAPSPAPILPSLPVVSATPAPAFPSIPVSLPPPQFSFPAPAPSLPTFPAFPSFPVSAAPEPEFPYPPSGTPIPSYIKDISLGDIEIKGSALPTIEPAKFEDVTPVIEDGSKTLDPGFFQKIKGWKADKANAALSHFTQFMQKPLIHGNKIPVEVPSNTNVQFPGPVNPLPLAPASIFPVFPPAQFFSPAKYESFPPNNIETPPLLNSYGVPIPHDSYAPPHISHERLSSAASEEEPAVVPAPENKEQNLQRAQQQIRQEFQAQKFQPQAIPHEHPVYVAEDNKPLNDDNKTIEEVQQEASEYKTPKEPNTDEVTSVGHNYPNHKE